MNIVGWVLQIAAAGMFLLAGGNKLAGNEQMVQLFDAIGVGQWFRYVTGGIEVVGAIGLLVPAAARFAAPVLGVTMVGAALTHVVILHNSPAIPLVLLVVVGAITWIRRNG